MGLFPVEADGKNLNRKVFCIEISPSAAAGDLSDGISSFQLFKIIAD
jgi:hypothetical protein